MSILGLLMTEKDQHMPWWCHQCPAVPSQLIKWLTNYCLTSFRVLNAAAIVGI